MNQDLNQTVDEISFFVPNDSGRFSFSIKISAHGKFYPISD